MENKTLGEMIANNHLRYAAIDNNRKMLDACPGHDFGAVPELPFDMETRFLCKVCHGRMKAVDAFRYIQGWQAAGRNPNEVMQSFEPDWKPVSMAADNARAADQACNVLVGMGYAWDSEFGEWLKAVPISEKAFDCHNFPCCPCESKADCMVKK